MSAAQTALLLAALFLGAPLATSIMMTLRARTVRAPADLRLSVLSLLAFALAYNLVFLVQELGLVIPKAFTPGLTPVLFHNNHDWSGHHPLENLFQGTGAAATVLLGLSAAAWVALRPPRSDGVRLFAIWTALIGLVSAFAQVIIGTAIPQNDVGRAMDYLRLADGAKLAACAAAIVVMAAVARWAAGRFLALAPRSAAPGFIFQTATLPALLAVILIVPFRLPGAPIELLLPPGVAAVTTAVWLQAWSWRARADGPAPQRETPLWLPAVALAALLAFFHLVLRPGVPFS